MSTISESNLPGVGRKFQIETISGDRLIVVIHDDGLREIYHFNKKNPDKPASVLAVTDGEARQIAGIIGGLSYVPKALPTSEVVLDDLVLEWFVIEKGAASIGKTIAQLEARTMSGASIVSIIEPNQQKRVNPGPDTVINEGATFILAGDRRNIGKLKTLLLQGNITGE
ncbi:MAG: cation:proton antiporter regulatory subunit [Acidobacteria bacterium]|nr:cation:proton antiporter regulatory subunit [Acidobacteriota bacterium]